MKSLKLRAAPLGILLTVSVLIAGAPQGMDDIFNNVEPGKKFHPLWPPINGQDVLGTVVIAKSPNRPQAYFQTINSPSYRNPSYTKDFIVGTLPLTDPTLGQEKTLEVTAAFSQLDEIGKALKAAAQASSLLAHTPAPPTAAAPSTKGTSGDTTNPATPAAPETQKPANSGSGTSTKVTGADFKKFSQASVKVTGLAVKYYDLPTLMDIEKNHALTPGAELLLQPGQRGWIIHRELVASSLEYTLTSDTNLEAGFFAKLVLWLPTVSTTYKNNRTVTIKTTAPVTFGYKLWRPGVGPAGQATQQTTVESLGIDSATIDQILKGTQPK